MLTQTYTEKQFANMDLSKLESIHHELSVIYNERKHCADCGIASEADYDFLRNILPQFIMANNELDKRENLKKSCSSKTKHNHDKRDRREGLNKKRFQ